MLSKKLHEAMNAQINAELWSAYLYLSMSMDAEAKGLKGVANWFYVQFQEEQDHARIFMNYILSRDAEVKLLPIEEVRTAWTSPLEMFQDTLVHEKEVTAMINNLAAIAAEDKVLPYLDIPIQHCNDKVLKAMNRRGDKVELLALFRKLRGRIPGLVLRTSLITGLPYEDEAAFEELCEFLQEVRIERAGVFPYSPEEGTPAARMLNRVDTDEAERRADLIVDVQSRIMDDFNDSRMGTVAEVLCDGFDSQSMMFVGRSYAESPDIDGRIYFTADHEVEAGEFVPVRITGAMDGELTGEVAE